MFTVHVVLCYSMQEEFFFGDQIEDAMFADTVNFLEPLIPASDSLPLLFPSILGIHGDKVNAPSNCIPSFSMYV